MRVFFVVAGSIPHDLARHVEADDADVELVTFGPTQVPPGLGVPVHRLTALFGAVGALTRRFRDLVAARRPDLIHVYDPHGDRGSLVARVAHTSRIPVVAEVRRGRSLPEAVLRAASHLTVPSPSLRRPDAEVLFDPRPRVESLSSRQVRNYYRLGQRPILLHACPIPHEGRARMLVELAMAFAEIDPWVSVIIRAGPSGIRRIRNMCRGTEVLGRQLLTTTCERGPDLDVLLAAADMALVTGGQDRWVMGAPFALQALTRGRTVTTFFDDWLSDVVEVADAGLRTFGDDPEFAARQIRQYLRDPYWRTRAPVRAKELASRQEFDPQRRALQLGTLWRKAARVAKAA